MMLILPTVQIRYGSAGDIEDDFMIFYEQDNKMCLYARNIG